MKFIKKIIDEMVENYKIKKDFKENCGGIQIRIDGNNLDKIYDKKEYESISRYGPYRLPVRAIKTSVYDWCLKAKGIIRVPEEYRTEYQYEYFAFSRKKDAIEFKRVFNIT